MNNKQITNETENNIEFFEEKYGEYFDDLIKKEAKKLVSKEKNKIISLSVGSTFMTILLMLWGFIIYSGVNMSISDIRRFLMQLF